jgi:hypothetical protein
MSNDKSGKKRALMFKLTGDAATWCIIVGLMAGCVPLFKGIQGLEDTLAPELVSYRQTAAGTVLLEFSESVSLVPEETNPGPEGTLEAVEDGSATVSVSISGWDVPGRRYELSGSAKDANGNLLWFCLPFYGFNAHPADVVINEFINENSSTRYEKAELFVRSGGNLGGLTIYNGAPGMYRSFAVFADQEVRTGEYLVVHFRGDEEGPEYSAEIDEYGPETAETLNAAASSQAIADVRDFWVRGIRA